MVCHLYDISDIVISNLCCIRFDNQALRKQEFLNHRRIHNLELENDDYISLISFLHGGSLIKRNVSVKKMRA